MAISNQEFISTIFCDLRPDEYCWSTVFTCSPEKAKGSEWDGNRSYPDQIQDTPFGNSYFCVSALKPYSGQSRRRKDNFSRLMCVVLDDPQSCDLAPSWKIETSQDNFQIGFILSDPIEDIATSDRFHQALANGSFIKVDSSGNNSVRYVRLPVGLNTKYQPNFQCVMRVWNPELVYSMNEICEALGLKLIPTANDHSNLYQHSGQRITDSEYYRQIMSGESFHESINVLSARMHYRGMEANNIIETLQGTMLAVKDDSDRWQSRFDDIPRSVKGAVEKFKSNHDHNITLEIENKVIGLNDFMSGVRAPCYVWQGIIQKNNLYAVTASPGSGKTAISLALALAMTQGLPIHGRKTMQSRVLYLCGENPDDVRLRFKSLMVKHGISLSDAEGKIFFTQRPFRIDDQENRERFLAEARLHAPYDIVFIDTVPAHSSIDDENDNSKSHALAISLRSIGETIGEPCILALMHPVKGANRENLLPRGGSALTGSIDGVICIWRDNNKAPSEMFAHKGKFRGNWTESFWFDLKTIDHPDLRDNFGYPASSVVALECIKDKNTIAVDVDPLLMPTVKEQILTFIHYMTSRGDWVGDDWSAPNSNNICKKTHHDFEQFPSMLKLSDGKRLALKAIDSLKSDGLLIKENREVPNKLGKSKRDRSAIGLWLTPKALELLAIVSGGADQPEIAIQSEDVALGV